MEVKGEAITHAKICGYFHDKSRGNYQLYVKFLDDIYKNGIDIDIEQYEKIENADKIANILFWITLQEEINYPQNEGHNGRKLSFCRFFEAVYAANYNDITIETVKKDVGIMELHHQIYWILNANCDHHFIRTKKQQANSKVFLLPSSTVLFGSIYVNIINVFANFNSKAISITNHISDKNILIPQLTLELLLRSLFFTSKNTNYRFYTASE